MYIYQFICIHELYIHYVCIFLIWSSAQRKCDAERVKYGEKMNLSGWIEGKIDKSNRLIDR